MRRPNRHHSSFAWLAVGVCLSLSLASCRRQERSNAPSGTSAPPAVPSEKKITTPSGLVMILIPAGEFVMGNAEEVDAKPTHKVSLSAFYMAATEVTQDVYQKVMGKNPSKNKGDRNPVERVTWLAAITFCNRLSTADGLKPCYDLKTRRCDFVADGYRLPTEAEWEYACRAGTSGDYYFAGQAGLKDHAWYKGNSMGMTHPVGKKPPNPFGLYDVLGNVREWCNDWYQVDGYAADADKPTVNPTGPSSAEKKVLRGGAWSVTPQNCTTWARFCEDPGFTDACLVNDDCGFRIVKRAEPTPSTTP
jgi:formylglycine-generating enzyme required for sulfatase activity